MALCVSNAGAQTGGGDKPSTGAGDRQIIDGIAAAVGNEIILISDVLQRALLVAQQNPSVDPNDPELHNEILNSLIAEKLLLVRAEEDSIQVSEDLVNGQVDQRVQQLTMQAGGEENLEKYYNMSIAQIRQEAKPLIRQQLQIRMLQEKHFADMKLTERDINEFYRLYQDSLPEMPEQIEIAHIMLKAKPGDSAKSRTITLANAIIDSIKNGGDFADFAKRYSTDPGSGSKGGDLGFMAKGKLVAPYEQAAEKLGINEISGPVETQFGIHIIQVTDRRDDKMRSRHILLPLKQSESEKQEMITKLEGIRTRALNGEDFGALATEYSEDNESKAFDGVLGKFPVDQLPPNFKRIVTELEVGEISEPKQIALSPTESGYHIVKVIRKVPAHALDPEDDRDQLERLARVYKENKELSDWVAELRNEIYWDIKHTFN